MAKLTYFSFCWTLNLEKKNLQLYIHMRDTKFIVFLTKKFPEILV